MGDILNTVFYEPLYNALIIFYHLLGDNLGLAIIAIAIAARTLMLPITLRQIKMAESNREFSEKMKEVKKKYKNDKEKEKEELMKLQSEYLPAQLGGCLPMIFQLIFFIYMYRVIRNIIDTGGLGFNKVAYNFVDTFPDDFVMDGDFFGIVNLTKSASKIMGSDGFGTEVLPYFLLILGVGAAQYASMKILAAMRKTDKTEKKKEKKDRPEDFGEIMQQSTRQTMMMMPILIMFISYSLPAGLGFYWITQSAYVILQQAVITRIQGLRGKVTDDRGVAAPASSADRDLLPAQKKGGVIDGDEMIVKVSEDKKKSKDKKKKKSKKKKR